MLPWQVLIGQQSQVVHGVASSFFTFFSSKSLDKPSLAIFISSTDSSLNHIHFGLPSRYAGHKTRNRKIAFPQCAMLLTSRFLFQIFCKSLSLLISLQSWKVITAVLGIYLYYVDMHVCKYRQCGALFY